MAMERKKFKELVEHHCDLVRVHNLNTDFNMTPHTGARAFKLKPRSEICDDCGVIVADRTVTYSRSMSTDYWTKKCSNCPLKSTSKEFKL